MGQLLRLIFLGLIGLTLYRYLQRTFGVQVSMRPPSDTPDDRDNHYNGHDATSNSNHNNTYDNAYGSNRNADSAPAQIMRRCAYCKVHVPEGESMQSRGQYFCCEKHRDAYFRETP
jgi:hypothetical protein